MGASEGAQNSFGDVVLLHKAGPECVVEVMVHIRKDIRDTDNLSLERLCSVPFLLRYDVPFSLGYYMEMEATSLALITDTGEITDEIYSYARQAEILFLEANYDEEMLENGLYPAYLKKRIASREGHLSNKDAIDLLNRLYADSESRVEMVYFCHLSRNNNSPEILQESLDRYLEWQGKYIICPRGEQCSGNSPTLDDEHPLFLTRNRS